MKTLVVYYSFSGKTELVARAVATAVDADIRKIEEAKPRRGGPGLYIQGGSAAYQDKRSEIKPPGFDVGGYDRIMIGSPVWAAKPAPAINAFISQTDFTGKDVVVFCTMGARDVGGYFENITKKIEANSGRVVGSFAVRSQRTTDTEMAERTREAAAKYVTGGVK